MQNEIYSLQEHFCRALLLLGRQITNVYQPELFRFPMIRGIVMDWYAPIRRAHLFLRIESISSLNMERNALIGDIFHYIKKSVSKTLAGLNLAPTKHGSNGCCGYQNFMWNDLIRYTWHPTNKPNLISRYLSLQSKFSYHCYWPSI